MARRPAVLLLALLLVPAVAGPALASDQTEVAGRLLGHARERFPLTVHLPATGDATLDAALDEALVRWNEVAVATLGVAAFARTGDPAAADVVVALLLPSGEGPMGLTRLAADARGFLERPVQVTLAAPRARGQTPADRLLFQVAAHELGHALGLMHVADPVSIMCCDHGQVNLADPATRAAYVAARRRPDVGTAAAQLADHYRRFWSR